MLKHIVIALTIALVACADDEISSTTTSAATISNPYGLNAHVASTAMLNRFADIGIGWYRVDADWPAIEPIQGQFQWGEIDRAVNAIKARQGFVNVVLAYTPSWASGTSNRADPPLQPQTWVNFVQQATQRFRGRVDCISIWNEPNLSEFWRGTRAQYLNTILVPGLQAVKQVAPELPTCGPDLSSSGNERDDWMAPILQSAGSLLNIITHHQYDGNDTPSGRVAEIQLMHDFVAQRGHGSKPFWITEIGWRFPGTSRAQQAQFLQQIMAAMAARPWWNKTFWYDSHGVGWGLLDGEGGAVTPAFDAYRAVIANSPHNPNQTPGPGPGPTVLVANEILQPNQFRVSGDGRFRLVFQGDGNLVLYQVTGGITALWSTGTNGSGAAFVAMQSDGNLVMYSATSAVLWSTNTWGHPNSWLVVQDDGNLVLYAPGPTALWSSGTCCH
jgi:hypothetical protein